MAAAFKGRSQPDAPGDPDGRVRRKERKPLRRERHPQTFVNVNGYTAVITRNTMSSRTGSPMTGSPPLPPTISWETLKADANKGSDKITVDYSKGVRFSTDKRSISASTADSFMKSRRRKAMRSPSREESRYRGQNKAGSPVFLVRPSLTACGWITPRRTHACSLPESEYQGGAMTVAENIESLSFRYRCGRSRTCRMEGKSTARTWSITFVGVRITLIGRPWRATRTEGGCGFSQNEP